MFKNSSFPYNDISFSLFSVKQKLESLTGKKWGRKSVVEFLMDSHRYEILSISCRKYFFQVRNRGGESNFLRFVYCFFESFSLTPRWRIRHLPANPPLTFLLLPFFMFRGFFDFVKKPISDEKFMRGKFICLRIS